MTQVMVKWMDVAPWCYKWDGWDGIGWVSPGGEDHIVELGGVCY